jgi:hypothetical protein
LTHASKVQVFPVELLLSGFSSGGKHTQSQCRLPELTLSFPVTRSAPSEPCPSSLRQISSRSACVNELCPGVLILASGFMVLLASSSCSQRVMSKRSPCSVNCSFRFLSVLSFLVPRR